jgi:hypothetical protein
MKAKKTLIIITSLVAVCFILTGCYRKKILVDQNRANEQLIPIEQARQYQKSFIASHEELARVITDTSFLKKHFMMPNAETFNRDMISLLLNQEGADGIRIYYGEDEKGNIKLVLLPVDKSGNDIIIPPGNTSAISMPGISGAYAQGGGQAGENGQNCPPCLIH